MPDTTYQDIDNVVLKLSFWSHFRKLWMLLLYCFGILFILWALSFENAGFLFAAIMIVTLIVPTIVIHLNHYKYSKNRTVTLLGGMIKAEGVAPVLTVDVNDITRITVYMSGTRYSNRGLQSFPFENYFYCKVDTTSQGSFFLSSLFSDKLDKLLEERYNVTFIRERKYYPIIN